MKVSRFEDLSAWQEARKLTKRIYEAADGTRFAKDFGLRDQVQRAAVSIMANISEGFESGSRNEFIHFLRYANRSAAEVQSHLYVALDRGYVSEQVFNELSAPVSAVKKLIGGLIRYLRAKPLTAAPQNRSTAARLSEN